MVGESIEEGFQVFVSDVSKPFGAVRQVRPHGKSEIVVYIENAGDFTIPLDAVTATHFQKVIVDFDKLDGRLQKAIKRAHDAEDRSI